MKKRLQGLIVGILIGVTITSGLVFSKSGTEIIEALYNNIKIYIDGVKIEPTDATGKTVEPFIYNGTTYLPVRAVGEAIGKTVTWDDETQSIYLGEFPIAQTEAPITQSDTYVKTTYETVYITPTGKKYHRSVSCAGGNAMPRDLSDVQNSYGPCKKCAQ